MITVYIKREIREIYKHKNIDMLCVCVCVCVCVCMFKLHIRLMYNKESAKKTNETATIFQLRILLGKNLYLHDLQIDIL